MLRTKIVASYGPACQSPSVLQSMFKHGARVFRVNTSFLSPQEAKEAIMHVRNVLPDVAILVDLQGFKIRISSLDKEVMVKKHDVVILTTEEYFQEVKKETDDLVLAVDYPKLLEALRKNTVVHINEGKIVLKVLEHSSSSCRCRVEIEGAILPRKTVNVPGVVLDFPSLSDKDKDVIKVAQASEVEFLALSFVRSAKDVADAKFILGSSPIKLIAKIENKEGIRNYDEILGVVDGIMIARGDLGVETPLERIPFLQKTFIKKARQVGKPCIVATHMLESMIHEIVPTRAEVSDIANAVFDGADALMLSGESAVGKYPVKAVQAMAKIAQEMEKHYDDDHLFTMHTVGSLVTNAIACAALQIVDDIHIDAILVATSSGTTARALACFHPRPAVFAFTETLTAARQLNLTYGVQAIPMLDDVGRTEIISIKNIVSRALEEGFIKKGDVILIISGENIMSSGATNMITVRTVS